MGCEDVRRQFSVRPTALVQPDTTQVYFECSCAFILVLHVSACT